MSEEKPLSGTMVPVNFVYENEDGEEENFSIELDGMVFYNLCQEAMKLGMRVEDYIIEKLLEYTEENDGACS